MEKDDKKCECGMPLDEKTTCKHDETKCIHCCEDGCADKAEEDQENCEHCAHHSCCGGDKDKDEK